MPLVTLSVAKGIGEAGHVSPTPIFFVTEFTLSQANVLLRMTFDTTPLKGEEEKTLDTC